MAPTPNITMQSINETSAVSSSSKHTSMKNPMGFFKFKKSKKVNKSTDSISSDGSGFVQHMKFHSRRSSLSLSDADEDDDDENCLVGKCCDELD